VREQDHGGGLGVEGHEPRFARQVPIPASPTPPRPHRASAFLTTAYERAIRLPHEASDNLSASRRSPA